MGPEYDVLYDRWLRAETVITQLRTEIASLKAERDDALLRLLAEQNGMLKILAERDQAQAKCAADKVVFEHILASDELLHVKAVVTGALAQTNPGQAVLDRLEKAETGNRNHLALLIKANTQLEKLERVRQRKVVCLCGSTRFYSEFQQANYYETMAGRIVLTVGFYPHASAEVHGQHIGITGSQKDALDELHLRKIDLADEVLILNVDGYMGESTRREWEYAVSQGKPIRWLEPEKALAPDEEVKP